MTIKTVLLTGIFVLICLVSGCQKLPFKVVKLEGTLKYAGEPLENYEISFIPEGDGRQSSAIAGTGGRFKAKYSPTVMGVQTGKLFVKIIPLVSVGPGETHNFTDKEKELNQKYGYASQGFPIEVTKANKNFVIDLP